MVEMNNIKILEEDKISMDCKDENDREFHLVFAPSELKVIKCDVATDMYVFHAMCRVAEEYKDGTLKKHSIAMWY